jgi:hypothetical protein
MMAWVRPLVSQRWRGFLHLRLGKKARALRRFNTCIMPFPNYL